MIYILLFIYFAIPVCLYDYHLASKSSDITYSRRVLSYFWSEMVLLILIAGLRNKVGLDTLGYMSMWKGIPLPTQLHSFDFLMAKYQPLWYILSSVCKSVNGEFCVFQIVHALIINSIIFFVIKACCKYVFTAALIYLLQTFLYFNCEVLRESLAVCMFLIAMKSFVECKWRKYYAWLVVGFMFHPSIIFAFFLPLFYDFLVKPLSLKSLLYIFFAFAIVLNEPVVKFLLGIVSERLAYGFTRYSQMERGSILGEIRNLIGIVLVFSLAIFRGENGNKMVTIGLKIFLLLQLLGIPLPIAQTRLSNYVRIFYILSIVDLIWSEYYRRLVFFKLIFFASFTFGLVRYYTRDVTFWVGDVTSRYYFYESYYPYYSIFEDIPNSVYSHRKTIHIQNAIHRD